MVVFIFILICEVKHKDNEFIIYPEQLSLESINCIDCIFSEKKKVLSVCN